MNRSNEQLVFDEYMISERKTSITFANTRLFAEPPTIERGRTLSRISVAKGSNLNFKGRKSNSLMNLCGKAPTNNQIQNIFFSYFISDDNNKQNQKNTTRTMGFILR